MRLITAEDQSRVVTVAVDSGLFSADEAQSVHELVAGYLEQTPKESDDRFWMLSEVDGRVIGTVYVEPERMASGSWNMLMLAVCRQHQGTGVGTGMVRRVEEELVSRGGRLVLVETAGLPKFEGARNFYRGRGYAEEGNIRDFYEPGVDKVIFRKLLMRK